MAGSELILQMDKSVTVLNGPQCEKKTVLQTTKVQTNLRICADLSSVQSEERLCYLLFESEIVQLAPCNISEFKLAFLAEQADLCFTWSETKKAGFLAVLSITRLTFPKEVKIDRNG